jgi:gamma-glutamyltranspeptidase/glutathione hydrolase
MLNILEHFDLASHGQHSAASLHLQIEAMRRAYLDRARHLGDPDFVEVPIARLISKDYAKALAAGIDPKKASSSVELGRDIVTTDAAPAEPEETTHLSVMDASGMAVTTTTTLEGSYGSHVVVKGAGFLLNNEMGDFNKKPGETNRTGDIGTPANVIDPGKRMLSSMTPTMVLKDGKVVLLTGSPGGRTIINTVLTVVLGVTEFGLDGRQAVTAARLHHQWLPDQARIEANGVTPDVLAALKAMGHDVTMQGRQGDAHTIWVAPDGTPHGVHDQRTPDSKASAPARLTGSGTRR